ncbi:hypothetical protein DHW03_14980 [Pedobacter yonginense]|uniref:Uncharacterized protein n=1 Tax=Pedobacter yonginense TaxID=651869 RepID=A0A317EH07_9SPHI|nr:hypothetical protein [Pedobacter yonginense]PWS26100.1 hypothetical protein DHW03_14980 [Pedobacter yonginense]
MALNYQKFFIVFILLISFGSRVVAYAVPFHKSAIEVLKQSDNDEADQSDTPDEEDQVGEKLKLTDLLIPKFSNFEFADLSDSKAKLFEGHFNLTYCHLTVQEQPPK